MERVGLCAYAENAGLLLAERRESTEQTRSQDVAKLIKRYK